MNKSEEVLERLSQYQRNDDQFRVSHETEQTLPAGIYNIDADMMGISFTVTEHENDDVLQAEDPRLDHILEEAITFWAKKPKYTALGLKHKRGILLESAPGTGKSVLMRRIAEDAIAKNAIIFNTTDPHLLIRALKQVRQVEKDRNILVMFDDIDAVLYAESSLISLFDGENSINNVLFVASTNYIERFPKRLIRPGRFDTVVKVESPPTSVRNAYFQDKIPTADKPRVATLTKESNGFSFAQMKELLVSTSIYDRSIPKEAARIRAAQKLGESRTNKQNEANMTRSGQLLKHVKEASVFKNGSDVRYMAPDGSPSAFLKKFHNKPASIVSTEPNGNVTLLFKSGKKLTEVPVKLLQVLGNK